MKNNLHTRWLKETAAAARTGSAILSFLSLTMGLSACLLGFLAFDNMHQTSQKGSSSWMKDYKPEQKPDGHPETENLGTLAGINPDVIGWIELKDTRLDQPFVQGRDDLEYLNKDAKGQFSLAGAVFLSCTSSPDFSDPCSLMYGHHMEDGGMFGDLDRYLDPDFLESHQEGRLTTLNQVWDLHVFAVVETDASDRMIYFPGQFQSSQDLLSLQNYLKEHSSTWCDLKTQPEHLLLLSTCQDADSDARLVAAAWMEPEPAYSQEGDGSY